MAAAANSVSLETRVSSLKDVAPLAGNLVAYRTNLLLFGRKEGAYTLSDTCFGYIVKEPEDHKFTETHSVKNYRFLKVVRDSKDPHSNFCINDFKLSGSLSWLYMKVATKTEQASIRNAISQGHAVLGYFPKDKAIELLSQ